MTTAWVEISAHTLATSALLVVGCQPQDHSCVCVRHASNGPLSSMPFHGVCSSLPLTIYLGFHLSVISLFGVPGAAEWLLKLSSPAASAEDGEDLQASSMFCSTVGFARTTILKTMQKCCMSTGHSAPMLPVEEGWAVFLRV
eukprot:6479706-Amphidinium_carterae.2